MLKIPEVIMEVYRKIIEIEINNLIYDATGRFIDNCEALQKLPIEQFLK